MTTTLAFSRHYYVRLRSTLVVERARKRAAWPLVGPYRKRRLEEEIGEVEQAMATLDELFLMVTVETCYAD